MRTTILDTLDTTTPKSTIENLPTEVITQIIEKTSLRSRVSLALTSKTIAGYLVNITGECDYQSLSQDQIERQMASEDISSFILKKTNSGTRDHLSLMNRAKWHRECSYCGYGGFALGNGSDIDTIGQWYAAMHLITHWRGLPYMTHVIVRIMTEAVRLKTNVLFEEREKELRKQREEVGGLLELLVCLSVQQSVRSCCLPVV